MYRFFLISIIGVSAFADDVQNWASLEKLKGEWVGVGGGKPGDGSGSFTFLPEMRGTIYVCKNRADYIDNEGHVIHYVVTGNTGTVEFVSSIEANAPRYRMRYNFTSATTMKLRFDIAAAGKPELFTTHITADLVRK